MDTDKNTKTIIYEEGRVLFNLNSSRNEILDFIVKNCIGFKPTNVYDPICGCGELLALFDDDVEKFGDDICEEKIEEAKKNVKNFNGVAGDTLKSGNFASIQSCKKFDSIVSVFPDELRNKKVTLSKNNIIFEELPFELFDLYDSIMERKCKFSYYDSNPMTPMKYNENFFNIDYEYAYLLHILCHLKDDGVAVVACSDNVLYNSDFFEFEIRKLMFEKGYIDKIIKLREFPFSDEIPHCVLILRKNRDNSKVKCLESDGKIEEMSLDEIRRRCYCIY